MRCSESTRFFEHPRVMMFTVLSDMVLSILIKFQCFRTTVRGNNPNEEEFKKNGLFGSFRLRTVV
jgi:hypothetical protein